MKLKTKQAGAPVHAELSPACGWSIWGELFSCSDDQTIHKWDLEGKPEGKVGWVRRNSQRDSQRAVHSLHPCMPASRSEGGRPHTYCTR